MCNICVFAGTTEGRELVEFLAGQPAQATVCVATEYGETLLPEAENITVLAGHIPVEDIIRMLQRMRFDLVIDATHPYATSITESICTACRETETEYLRLLRQSSEQTEDVVCVENAAAAAAFLESTRGNILLTTASKELAAYSGIPDFTQRVYARVLPMDASLEACRAAGLKAAHIIAMQGPFSEEMDLATLRFADAAWMVTKDGGEAGGFPAKASAARKAGAGLVVIGRPPQREGLPFAAVLDVLCKRFGCTVRPQVRIVGIGPGSREAMTREVSETIEVADCLIGAKRMLEAVARPGQYTCDAIAPQDIADFIRTHWEYRRFAVVMSGDTGFFSGTKKLLPLLESCDTAAELTDGVYAPLSVALIENPHPDAVVTPGLPDDAFLRSAEGMPVVPMTKSEVRTVCWALPQLHRYPDPYCRRLVQAIAGHEQVPASHILCGNGAADLIYTYCAALRPRTAVELAPTFMEYGSGLAQVGCRVERHFLHQAQNFDLDERFLSFLEEKKPEVVFLCNPKNPTGRLIPLPLLEQILQYCAAQGARLFLDECFLDLTEDGVSAKSLLAAHPELLLLKAFTKSYGMAGIRLGYCLCADNALLRRMAAASPPWNVSTPAQSAGVAALAERDFLQRTLSLVRTERRWLTDNLTALGFWVCPSHANYLLFCEPLGLREGLLQQGIAIRGCGNYNGLGDGWYRIAVRPHGENEALITAIRQFCKEKALWQ